MVVYALTVTAKPTRKNRSPSPEVESFVAGFVQWLLLLVEITGACIIAFGAALALGRFIRGFFRQEETDFNAIRLILARYLALALEFQLGADILSTAVAPGWEQIGKLGAIAIIRTALNYFLSREMKEERAAAEKEKEVTARAQGKAA